MSKAASTFDEEFRRLRELSARIGSNPLLIQGAGGNTSIKQDELLWIKASGKWLARSTSESIFLPVRFKQLLSAVASGSPEAETPELFVQQTLNERGLRPSIETTVHALMPQKVVVHVHCVDTIALAVREDSENRVAERLAGFDHAFVPYARPGLPLARAIAARLRPHTNVLVLGNHGLVVAADTVDEASRLLGQVCGKLAVPSRTAPSHNAPELEKLAASSTYRLPSGPRAHGAATDLASLRFALGGSLYPDHVIFLGIGSYIAQQGETVVSIIAANNPNPVSILFPGMGVLMRADASPGADAMAGCLADVLCRIEQDAKLRYLTDAENSELLDWDAEKYRQQLNETKEPAT